MRKIKKASLKWRFMLVLAGMTASAAWGQGIIYVTPSSPIYYSPLGGVAYSTDLDINGDGVTDLIQQSDGGAYAWLIPQNGSFIAVNGMGVANFTAGDMVGADTASQYGWTDSQSLMSSIHSVFDVGGGTLSEGGNFAGQTNGYVGFDLVVGGNNYYGWMQVTSILDAAIGGEITGWAYSTVPNVPIMVGQVPEPETLALLGLGGMTLGMLCYWRRFSF